MVYTEKKKIDYHIWETGYLADQANIQQTNQKKSENANQGCLENVQNQSCLLGKACIRWHMHNNNGLFQKKNEQGGGWLGYGIFRGSKEIACGFQEWPRKNDVEFPGILFFSLRISKKYS